MVADSHCHLADRRLRDEVEAVIVRARTAGVTDLIAVGAIGSIETDRLTVAIAESHDRVHAVIGVHPHNAIDCNAERMAALRELAASPRVVAIGETGLDFHYMHSSREAQELAMRQHLELAAELGKPIVIHCRDAEARLVDIVRETGSPVRGGVIHCFTGDANSAARLIELGFYLSFSGIVTFRNAAALRAAAATVPDDRLMVETDAPYLAPEPYRGKTNEPAFVVRTIEELARIRSSDCESIGRQTAANTRRFFGLV